jgi:hypothetical protein
MPDAESNLLTGFQTLIERAVEARVRPLEETIKHLRGGATELDEATLERIRLFSLVSHKPYLTKKEAALYLDVSERSIGEWTSRPVSQNPLPAGYAGGEPRYQRQKMDEWAEREAQRRRLKMAG